MASSTFCKCNFETLTKDNYYTWKIQVRALLIKNDAWEYVNGDLPKPQSIEGDANSANALREWIKADLKAQSDIILTMSPRELKHIKGCDTAREMWLKLESVNDSIKCYRHVYLLKKLIDNRMRDDEDIREYLRKFCDNVDLLNALDFLFPEEHFTTLLLNSLPESFEHFRSLVLSLDKLPKFHILIHMLEEEGEELKSRDTVEKQRQNVKPNPQFYSKNNSKTKPRLSCGYCHKLNHHESQCRKKKAEMPY